MRFMPVLVYKEMGVAIRKAGMASLFTWGCITPLVGNALDTEQPVLSLRGFGTLGGVYSSEKHADFVSGFFEPNGAGYSHPWSLGIDSKLGLQADARFNNKLTAVLQLVSQHHYDNGYEPRIEWANVKYRITPDIDVRIGRTVTMPFMISDSRLVGYGNLWIRPPQEIYGLIPITNKDGFDATYYIHADDTTDSVHISYGQTSLKLPDSGNVKAKQYFELSNTWERGPASLRAAYSSGKVDLHTTGLDTVVNGLAQFGNTVSAIPGLEPTSVQAFSLADKYRFENAPISVISLGASYDLDQWILMSEWAHFSGHSLLADSSAWYATSGYRFGKFTPYFTVARLQAEKRTETGISTGGLPPLLAASAQELNGGMNSLLTDARFAQKSISAGVRWDFLKNAALKAQYDYVMLDDNSSGRLANVQTNFERGSNLSLFSIALDFTF